MTAFVAILLVQAQNLVPNGDFEQYTQCPDYVSQIDRAIGWFRPTEGTSDYLNACLGVPFSESVPDNEFGYQAAHSGNGYAGFYCFYATSAGTVPGDGSHEYVTHALASAFVIGQCYSVEFFVSLSDVSKYAVNDIGALLSVSVPHRTDDLAITMTPQIMNTPLAMLDDKVGWARIHGCFVADSAFAYITIGNFHVGAATLYEEVATNYPLTFYSYYYVDDVSVRAIERPDLGPDLAICSTAVLTVLDPVAGAEYTWSTGEVGTSIVVDSSGTYSVRVDIDGCTVTDTINVTLAEPMALALPADTAANFCANGSITLAIDALPTGATISWSTGATTPDISVSTAGTYTASVSAPGFCPANASAQVVDLCRAPVYAPNAFTPNNDGVNDVWRPVWVANDDAMLELTVFDRWGEVMFNANTRDATWDGTANGMPVPAGIYAWKGHAHDPITDLRTDLDGHITLIR